MYLRRTSTKALREAVHIYIFCTSHTLLEDPKCSHPCKYLGSPEALRDSVGVFLRHRPQPLQLLGRDTRPTDVHRTLQGLRLDLILAGDDARRARHEGRKEGRRTNDTKVK